MGIVEGGREREIIVEGMLCEEDGNLVLVIVLMFVEGICESVGENVRNI